MKIASAGIQHETNTFSNTPTTLADFVRDSECGENFDGGETVFARYRGTGTIHGGYIQAADELGIELVPLLVSKAYPSGLVVEADFQGMLDQIVDRLKTSLPVDGVALDLHGAMASVEHEDAESVIIAAVREVIGPNIPLFVTLDLHANITARMAELSDCIIGYDTYPHVDMGERGHEAINLLARTIRGEVKPVQQFRQLPVMTMPPMQCTLREPMQSLFGRVHSMESEDGVLTATVAMGFPFADIHDAGVSILVTVDGSEELANQKADELASWMWDLRDKLQPDLKTIEHVINFANNEAEGLVIFADGSDNPGGGAPCDGTIALQAMIDADFQGGLVGVLFDPETVEQAFAAGIGNDFAARIGAKTDNQHGVTVETDAYVKALSDGRYTHQGPMMHGLAGDMGRSALLRIGGVDVVMTTHRRQLIDAEMLRVVGAEPTSYRLLVVKSAVHFRAHIGPLASHIFDADTPGIHRPDFSTFDYENVRRPIYPLDLDVAY
ncbi:MAG: hypothetical protein CMJ78_10115 [Planctomycetaceae bacterium]|nr:hypothetical protein [Planctomycetaceae bacterium]